MARQAVVWFRDDLRVSDNPALSYAMDNADAVVALYVLDDSGGSGRPLGAASRWWLSRSLQNFSVALEKLGVSLILRKAKPQEVFTDIVDQLNPDLVCWNRRYSSDQIETDRHIADYLKKAGIHKASFNGNLLHEPWELAPQISPFYKVFTPFWKALKAKGHHSPPLGNPLCKKEQRCTFASDKLADWKLEPTTPNWAAEFETVWTPGEAGAQDRLYDFLAGKLAGYGNARDYPASDCTSRLSPHLRFGEISPRQIWHAAHNHPAGDDIPHLDLERFLMEIGWREFAYHLLYHLPDISRHNIQAKFNSFAWRDDEATLTAWQRGQTGYPLVDAAMRQLWQTGWMHNRARMIAASFLVKHLRLDWRIGEAWFWDTLVDADPANNPASWQWVAGSGADAAPYFRIFNPVLQGEKFDAHGHYVRSLVPELGGLPNKFIQKPWGANDTQLRQAGISLGHNYPCPIVNHTKARESALAAFRQLTRL